MAREFFDPLPEDQIVVLIGDAELRKAEKLIKSCEHCNADGAEIPFDNILDRVTGLDPSVTDYIRVAPAKCPNCKATVNEKTLVDVKIDDGPAGEAVGPDDLSAIAGSIRFQHEPRW